jgi:ATP-dependent Lon protease
MGVLPREVGLLPLRNSVLFPGGVLPLTVSRAATIRSLTDAASRDGLIGVVAQRDAFDELPGAGALFNVGVIAQVVKLVKYPTHCETVLQGFSRFRTVATVRETPFLTASIESFGWDRR